MKILEKKKLLLASAVILFALLIYIGLYILSFVISEDQSSAETSQETFYMLKDITNPEGLKWTDSTNVIFTLIDYNSGSSTLYFYDADSRLLNNLYEVNRAGVFSFRESVDSINDTDREIIFCSWENRQIFTPEDYATEITISSFSGTSTEELARLSFHETIRNIDCDLNRISAITNSPMLPGKSYEIDVPSRELFETAQIDGQHLSSLEIRNALEGYFLPENIDIKQYILSPDMQRVAFIDFEGVLWISRLK